jgi:predicted dehydrogenase
MPHATSRRRFMQTTGAAGAAVALSAASYARVAGANERLSIGVIGCGSRGRGAHMPGVHAHAKTQNLEITAVADPWRIAREQAAAQAKEWYGREARQFASYRDVLAMEDVDAVMIASPDHVHTTHLEAAAKAKKDVYCEKPLSMDIESLKRACDAVRAAGVVFQAGTQLRSFGTFAGCRKVWQSGVLGKVGRIEQHRNGGQPYWYGYVKEVNEADVDWKEFLADRPMRPFDPVVFSGWYGYREFSDGPVPGLGSHFIDLVHYITGAKFPTDSVCMGGTFTWNDERKFTCPDHVTALWRYPEGFMVEYTTNFGNGGSSTFRAMGDVGTLDMVKWHEPVLTAEGGVKNKGAIRGTTPVEPVEQPDHFLDWLQCIRTRKTCNASVDAGYQHAVAVIMAMRSYDTGRRMVYDAEKREIREG